jgi:tRNA nucleotidyltransferase/poly(A) polymerase
MNPAIGELLERPHVHALLSALADAGGEGRVVGGAVRDAVMGRPPGDIDIATPMMPQAVTALAKAKGWKPVPTGVEHGTVTIVMEGKPYEVTTLRRDVETDGRRAVVAFTDDFREDAFRRDFTLNALSLSQDGIVHDYATGIADAKAGLIRFMGDPQTRIREDYLRILRFFRFQASHGRGAPEPHGLAACTELRDGLAGISRERVRQELVKLLVAPGAAAAAAAMRDAGLWRFVLPGAAIDTEALARWTALDDAIPASGDPMSALAALARSAASPAGVARDLKLSRAELAMLELIAERGHAAEAAMSDGRRTAEAVYRITAAAFPAVLRARAAAVGRSAYEASETMTRARPFLADPPRLPFTGAELAARGVPPGPRMGKILKAAEEEWIAAGLPKDAATLERIRDDAMARAAAPTIDH